MGNVEQITKTNMSTHKEFIGFFTRRLRDMETHLRKSADKFRKFGAAETAAVQAEKANLIDRIVGAMIRDGEAWQQGQVTVKIGAAFGKTVTREMVNNLNR